MAKLAPVELALDLMAEVRVLDIAEDMERLEHPAQGGQGLGQPIRRGASRIE